MLARIASLALMGLLVLAGCTDDTDARGEGPTSDPPVSTSTPVEPVTSEPTSAPTSETADPTTETAKQFIKRFHAEVFAMQRSGDTSAFRGLTFGCGACDAFADDVDEVYESGGSASVGEGRVVELKQVGESGPTLIFDYVLVNEPGEVRDSKGETVRTFPGGREAYQANLRKRSGEWVVTELTRTD